MVVLLYVYVAAKSECTMTKLIQQYPVYQKRGNLMTTRKKKYHKKFPKQNQLTRKQVSTGLHVASFGGSFRYSSNWRSGGSTQVQQHSFVEIDHGIFFCGHSLPSLIQEGRLSVSVERMCTILVNHLEDLSLSRKKV